ncbi:hypothetical protein [Kosakonia pseudosacchari]|uniref:hypothetical protein n=1 Tax=Kosakonia pseudosacchari TaxID=1646340 RepID=UPI000A3D4E39|nr:hypothetical protein [Kosakonia pseudosacchari]
MKAEENILENWLKKSLWRDIFYKIGMWCVISIISFYIAAKTANFDIAKYLLNFLDKSMPQVNYGWMVLFIIIPVSFFMKDMEAMKPDAWGIETLRGKCGAALRKVTSDLLLWSSGISTALLTTSLIALTILFYREPQVTYKNFAQVTLILMVLFIFLCANVWCYFMLKRNKAALFSIMNSQRGVKLGYFFIMLFCLYGIHDISADIDKKTTVEQSQPKTS